MEILGFFSVTQILCGINLEDSTRLKTALFSNLGALKFVNLANLNFQKVQNLDNGQEKEMVIKVTNIYKHEIVDTRA